MKKLLLLITCFTTAVSSAQLSSRSFVPSDKSVDKNAEMQLEALEDGEGTDIDALFAEAGFNGLDRPQLLVKVNELIQEGPEGSYEVKKLAKIYKEAAEDTAITKESIVNDLRDVNKKVKKLNSRIFKAEDIPTFGLSGIGNTNTETFDNINASGKLAGYIRPYKNEKGFWEVDFAFNVNASNTDSLAVNTVLFPDVGSNSFSATVTYNWIAYWENKDYYLITPFLEFANKTITGRNDDSERKFYTLNTSFGANLQYLYVDGDDQVSFGLSPYLALVNVPQPGTKDYRYLLTGDEGSVLSSNIWSWGAKVAFQYNNFQIFADFRTVMGKKEDFPVEGFKGFHPNLGVVVNAEIFER